jgi:hypothetical protein
METLLIGFRWPRSPGADGGGPPRARRRALAALQRLWSSPWWSARPRSSHSVDIWLFGRSSPPRVACSSTRQAASSSPGTSSPAMKRTSAMRAEAEARRDRNGRTRLILDATSQEAPVRRSGHGGFGYLLGAASIRRLSVRHGSSARLDPVTHVAGARRIGTRADQARIEGQRDVSSSRRVRGRGYFVDRDGVRRIEHVRPAIGQPDSERISHNGGGGQSDPEPAGLGRLSGCRP